MCFTTCGPVRHSKNAPGLSVNSAMAVDRFKGFRPLRYEIPRVSPEATAESLRAMAGHGAPLRRNQSSSSRSRLAPTLRLDHCVQADCGGRPLLQHSTSLPDCQL